MTIALSVKVHDGLVLAADSASTISGTDQDGKRTGVINVYNTASKVFNLYKGLPIGCITWGAGSIGKASIATLAKDLRRRFSSSEPAFNRWTIHPRGYTIEAVANSVRRFFYEELYQREFETGAKPSLGFTVAGYSAKEDLAELWLVQINDKGECPEPQLIAAKEDVGAHWQGEPEAICRIVNGYGDGLQDALRELKVPDEQIGPAMKVIKSRLASQLITAPMPIQDAIDLARFLVHVTIMYKRFDEGAPTVGGPIVIAAITKHEGFRWIQRKHYYHAKLNPRA
ncbi:MAG: hypothetical protein IID41_18550 [Planctomycetes bacterium]|nr:hypothetical protein [Planctomycetota bacterium]